MDLEEVGLNAALTKLAVYATELTSQYEAAPSGIVKDHGLKTLAHIKAMAEGAQHVDVPTDIKLRCCATIRKLFGKLGNSVDFLRLDRAQVSLGATR